MQRCAPAPRNPAAILILAGATLLLAVGGCGHKEYEDSYPATSGVIADGGTVPGESVASGSVHGGSVHGESAAPQSSGRILFMASPGTGKPPQVIARTDSITTAPTAEFLAREALAAQRGAPVATQRGARVAGSETVARPAVPVGADQATPITLPAVSVSTRQTGTPLTATPQGTGAQADTRITILRQSGVNGTPTILKIIEAP